MLGQSYINKSVVKLYQKRSIYKSAAIFVDKQHYFRMHDMRAGLLSEDTKVISLKITAKRMENRSFEHTEFLNLYSLHYKHVKQIIIT